ncbi:unnamed protein product [Penicillium salamii]|uniref:Transferase n=1 Tax=Penicillium salamii TaxID=1612424 RepID=A0A9W4N836_9EURO|nr:unnamed protein product [Penicillium salamii]CAG8033477.1 unnamed protein product [Penicillium salamii]CAG8083339.1 unnamed protein product [Penicillium salamii]CAG8091483.1 unnamed protein product [Penicillium salamii]CAG8318736.1 unnamed protein product [Penicillium salamii]
MATLESARLFPAERSAPTTTPLSILDATVVRFAPTGAIWIFDAPNFDRSGLLDHLRSSLIATLSSFPQWSGQLQWAPVGEGNHTNRFNRPILTYGHDSDPGVEWTVIEHPIRTNAIAPTAKERASSTAGSRHGTWMGDAFDESLFVSPNQLALSNLHDYASRPGVQVQITLLDGGYAVGVKVAHCLADAQTLMIFMHLWSTKSQESFGDEHESSPMGEPIFNPQLLDSCAGGDIDGSSCDQALSCTARSLPLHRYSWWDIADEGYPKACIPTTENSKPPGDQLEHLQVSPSEPAPWLSWDFSRPASYAQLHFTGEELAHIKTLALADPDSRADISRLDALLAYLWTFITRSRGYEEYSKQVYLDLTIGARARVSPALPDSFVGSPLLITHVGAPGSSVCRETLGKKASQIRQTMQRFTPEAMGAILHDAAFEVSPQRLWQAFMGTEHTIVTSWLRLRLHDVNFMRGSQLRYAHAIMPKLDGCAQIMDSGIGDGGMDIALYLDKEAMEKLIWDKCWNEEL